MSFEEQQPEKKMSALQKAGIAVTIFVIGIIAMGSFVMTQEAKKDIRPAPSADRDQLVFKQYCLNNKQVLVIENELGGAKSYLWNQDMAGRPILCGEQQQVGPVIPGK